MQELRVNDLTGVSETLLIPLHYRAEESRAGSSSFKDVLAERFHDTIAYEWDKFQGGSLQRPGILARTAILDVQVKAFIASNPDLLLVNLGAGLDTRFHRLDDGKIEWIELDLPHVIAFRQNLREPISPRHDFLAASIFDKERWIPQVKRRGRSRILFVAEGLFPYFTESQHREIFGWLADNFPRQEMLFQTSAPSIMRCFFQHSALAKAKMNADLQWGLEESADVSSLNPKVTFISEAPLLTDYEKLPPEVRQRLSSDQMQRLSPDQIKKAAKIIHVRFT
jgi:O-methyltransferase involved in polyketide biosynthesis